jgi:TPR repeat protein
MATPEVAMPFAPARPLVVRSSALAAKVALVATALGAAGCGAGMFVDPTGHDSQACVEHSLRGNPHFGPAKEAFAVFEQNCFMDDAGACSALGVSYEVGVVGAPQPKKALSAFERACVLGNARGCVNFGAMLAKGDAGVSDAPRAVRLFTKACGGGEQAGCAKLAEAYRDGRGVAPDEGRAVDLFP